MSQIQQMRPAIIVTGSSGLIGTALLEALPSKYTVYALDVKEPKTPKDNVRYIKADLTDQKSVRNALLEVRALTGEKIESVFHLAAYYDFSGEASVLYQELTVKGTERLLEELSYFQVGQFVFTSSLLVMKPVEKVGSVLRENDPVEAQWRYPLSKVKAESVIRTHAPAIPKVILRVAGVYDDNCHSIPIAHQIQRIYEKKMESVLYPGDKTHGQSFIHLNDLISCFMRVLVNKDNLSGEELFLIGEPEVLSYEEMQKEIGMDLHGKEWPTYHIPKTVARLGAMMKNTFMHGENEPFIKPWMIDLADDHYPIEIHRAKQRLQWEPKYRLRDVLHQMLSNLKKDPQGWYRENNLKWEENGHFNGTEFDREQRTGTD